MSGGGQKDARKEVGTAYRASDLQRRYRELLDHAKDRPVQVLDRDGSALGVERWEKLVFEHDLREHAARAAQLIHAYGSHQGRPASEWARLTPYPWIAGLAQRSLDEFVSELQFRVLDAAQKGTIDELEAFLRGARLSSESRAPLGGQGHRLAELRSLAYHKAIAVRLAADPAVIESARARVQYWLEQGGPVHPAYAERWRSILELPPESVADVITRDDEAARDLRQCTPFLGVLTQRERDDIARRVRQEAGVR